MGQSVEFYRALKFNGVNTRLYIAPREGHGFMELRHALYKIMSSWPGSSSTRWTRIPMGAAAGGKSDE